MPGHGRRWSDPRGACRRELNVDERDCIFCKIARGEMDAGRAPVHVLVIPKRHVASLEEVTSLPEPVARRLFEVSSIIAGRLGVGESGYAVRINNGPDAGQEVFHLHLHVLGGERIGMP